ncbi:MAG: hypothetical protein KME30_32200 [Iphinoe sp. HA4291-MV1]|jgi:hypothetical protein|nr:hypothetical protein [Iphinoe sp. HA4291-MV1]
MPTRKTTTTSKTTSSRAKKATTDTTTDTTSSKIKAPPSSAKPEADTTVHGLYQAAKSLFLELNLNLKKKNRKYAVTIHEVDEIFNTPQEAIDWLERNRESLIEELSDDEEVPLEVSGEDSPQEQASKEKVVKEEETVTINEFGVPVVEIESVSEEEITEEPSEDTITTTTIDIDSIQIPEGEPEEQFKKAFESVFQKKSEDFYRPDVQAAKDNKRPLVFDLTGVIQFLELPPDASTPPFILMTAAKRGYTVKIENNTYTLA